MVGNCARRFGLGLFVVAGALGCGGGEPVKAPPTHVVEGIVLNKDGKPYAGGSIEFRHAQNPEFVTMGRIKEDGKFTVNTIAGNRQNVAGAQEGDYRVTIMPDAAQQEARPIPLTKIYTIKAGENKLTITLEK